MKKNIGNKKFLIFSLICILAGLISVSSTATARTEKRAANIKSKGIIDFENGTTVIDFSDLTYLADEIDLLEDTYKSETVNALSQVNTYFNMDGSTTHDQNESNLALENADILPFKAITDGIVNSQRIPTDRTYTGMHPGESVETSGNISEASADNLTLGTAAWVDGELVVGTGADNISYYTQGYTDGLAKLDNANVSYTYHQHTGDASKEGGCYTACKAVSSTDATPGDWYGECPDCGAWGWHIGNKSINVLFSCGTTVKVNQHVICSSCRVPFHTYDSPNHKCYILSCGKTTDSIESATVVFN